MRFGIRELVFVLMLVAMGAASYIFVIEPRNSRTAEVLRETTVKNEKLQQLDVAMQGMSDIGREIDKLTEAISGFEQKLPASRETEVIVKQVWEMAMKQGLTSKSIRPDKPIISASYAELPIRMVITGDFDGFYSFLLDLEKLRRITRMQDMKIEKLRDAEGQMQANVVLSIYFESPTVDNSGEASGSNRL